MNDATRAAKPVKQVLLLNPPGDRLYIRDQFCSHVSKGTYYWQPLDLFVMSGPLAREFDVTALDCIAEGIGDEEALRIVSSRAPDAIVTLTGSDSWPADMRFAARAREATGARIVAIGDILREDPEAVLEAHPFLDAGLTDFVTHGLAAWLKGDPARAENMVVRDGAAIRRVPAGDHPRVFTMPPPRYDLFPLERYSMPYHRRHPYAVMIASSWCPYGCSFCPFVRTPYRVRDAADVLENLERVRELGLRQVHFADYTFGVDLRQAEALVKGMIERKFGFLWSCNSRVDLVTGRTLELWRESGCDLVEFGVESGSQAVLDRYDKGTTIRQLRDAFRWCHQAGLRTLGTFILGLPGETEEDLRRTVDFALELNPTYASFNIASPRMGTPLRQQLIREGLITSACDLNLDSSRAWPVFETPELPAGVVWRHRQRALRRFYMRPGYLIRRLAGLGSLTSAVHHARNGLSVILQSLRSRPGVERSADAPR